MTYKVLVVDDEPSIRRALSMGLSTHGFQVDLASDGVTAVAMGRMNRYDFMLIDLRLPDTDGLR